MGHEARYWTTQDDGRIRCDLCPRYCALNDGQRGFCFVRQREGDGIVLTTYGRSSGFCRYGARATGAAAAFGAASACAFASAAGAFASA